MSGGSDVENNGGLAPVTSLFGDRSAKAYPKTAADVRQELEDRIPAGRVDQGSSAGPASAPSAAAAAEWRTEWDDDPGASTGARTGAEHDERDEQPIDLDAERAGRGRSVGGRRGVPEAADAAELGLLKKLRARQLSVSEAKTYLGQYGLGQEGVEAILDAFLQRGYLDDTRLSEQVVHAGVDRKGQGRQALSQSLAKRGIPRDIADAALAELPDDDAERALEFARSKAGSMRGLERDVALRRLAGQLARRGYGGSAALNAARQALDESTRPSGRVRFD
ncbi:regulatory protein [Microbacterium sp. BE35]|uniref:regulatory protein RecX n=1 Tax=Microbacterium sp. BE35 TaxID=2817773 RepID=UPI0028663967|nr:regulatory protein RecX [Microbacterium sp. BE35]MDR7189396.1 regulatory protein [Microbacterium sp. BE35]